MTLMDLKKGQDARISGYKRIQSEVNVINRLIELGLVVGATVTVIHSAPINRDPIALTVKGAIIAIGKAEAEQILVEEV